MVENQISAKKISDENFAVDVASQTTKVSWTPPENMTYDEWNQIGYTLQTVYRSMRWWLGDWLRSGEAKYGETYAQAIMMTDSSVETLKKYKAIAERIDPEDRIADLSWTHHFHVAYIPKIYHGPFLQMAYFHDLTSRQMRAIAELPDGEREHLRDLWLNFDGPDHGQTLMALRTFEKYGTIYLPEEEEEKDDTPQASTESTEHKVVLDGSTLTYDVEASADAIYDYWTEKGNPIVFCNDNSVEWDGMRLVAINDENGRAMLLWDMVSVT